MRLTLLSYGELSSKSVIKFWSCWHTLSSSLSSLSHKLNSILLSSIYIKVACSLYIIEMSSSNVSSSFELGFTEFCISLSMSIRLLVLTYKGELISLNILCYKLIYLEYKCHLCKLSAILFYILLAASLKTLFFILLLTLKGCLFS